MVVQKNGRDEQNKQEMSTALEKRIFSVSELIGLRNSRRGKK